MTKTVIINALIMSGFHCFWMWYLCYQLRYMRERALKEKRNEL